MRGIADANTEMTGVFTGDWNQPAPDGNGKLIANAVMSALVQHFHAVSLSNASVQPDILGRAYEYLIKQFADDAGAKAGEFFTPPEVAVVLIRILESRMAERNREMRRRPGRIYIMDQRTKWGGCSRRTPFPLTGG